MTSDIDDDTTAAETSAGGSGIGMEIFLGLLWLGTSAYVAHATLTGPGLELGGALGAAAEALPGLVPAMLLTSAGIASAAAGRFRSAGVRLSVGLLVGVVFGLVGGLAVRYGYGEAPSITQLAVVVALAGLIGGSVAALPEPVRDALQWAATWVFFAGVIAGVISITGVFGGGLLAPEEAQAAAMEKLGYIGAVAGGIMAGLYSPQKLAGQRLAWAWYPTAGALPGVLLLVADRLVRTGAADIADDIQVGDANALPQALIVIALGAVVAGIIGIRRRRDDD